MKKTSKYYKDLTIKEFTEAAERYEGKNAGIYEMCKYDYPQILEEIKKEPFTDLLDAGWENLVGPTIKMWSKILHFTDTPQGCLFYLQPKRGNIVRLHCNKVLA